MGGDRNTVHLLTRDGGEIARRLLAGHDQGRRSPSELIAHVAEAVGKTVVSAPVKIEIRQLPHGEGLALPAYQSAHAAGLDLLAAVPEDAPLVLAPGQYALVPTGLSIALPPGYRGAGPAALGARGQAWRHRAERAGHGGRGLSRRDRRAPDQPRRRAVHDPSRRAHRADGDRIRGPGGTRSRGLAFRRPIAAAAASARPAANSKTRFIHKNRADQRLMPHFFATGFAFTVWTLTRRVPLGDIVL